MDHIDTDEFELEEKLSLLIEQNPSLKEEATYSLAKLYYKTNRWDQAKTICFSLYGTKQACEARLLISQIYEKDHLNNIFVKIKVL